MAGPPPIPIDHDPWIDRVLCGRYQIKRRLAQGGMGAIYAGVHLGLRGPVAIKLLLSTYREDPTVRQYFLREAKVLAGLSHPHLVQVRDVDEHEGIPFLVMELLHGEDLARRLTRGLLPLDDALRFCAQAGSALAVAHASDVVHRDIKPANLFLCRHRIAGREQEIVKVVDFGVAKLRNGSSVTHRLVVGTPSYMAPEQLQPREDGDIDGRADQWALAATLCELLTGTPPFGRGDPIQIALRILAGPPAPLRTLRTDVPASVEQAVLRALAKDPAARFETMEAFVLAISPEHLPRVVLAGPPPRPRRPLQAVALGSLLLCVAGVARIGSTVRQARGVGPAEGDGPLKATRPALVPTGSADQPARPAGAAAETRRSPPTPAAPQESAGPILRCTRRECGTIPPLRSTRAPTRPRALTNERGAPRPRGPGPKPGQYSPDIY